MGKEVYWHLGALLWKKRDDFIGDFLSVGSVLVKDARLGATSVYGLNTSTDIAAFFIRIKLCGKKKGKSMG